MAMRRGVTKKKAGRSEQRKGRSRVGEFNGSLTVRMYNVGFGDCFLVSIPSSTGRPKRILFDCGSVSQDPEISMDDILQRIWEDCTDPEMSHPVLDVVVATHRHRDHVSGFAKPGWVNVEVGEVWMPWTEHPTDEEARRIRERQARLALALNRAVDTRLGMPGLNVQERAIIEGNRELALNALSNERAMATLHEGFSGSPKRRFLPDETLEGLVLKSDALPNVTVYVLGPSKVESVIRDMDPPIGKSYLRLLESRGEDGTVPEPFALEWSIAPDEYAAAGQSSAGASDWTLKLKELVGAKNWEFPTLSPKDQEVINNLGDLELAAAVSLDKAVNGTSLMLVLKVGQTHLLFPGDAQWGTWEAALNDRASRDILMKTKFLKVAHHGSHNATPTDFVEDIIKGKGVHAMVSTRPVSNWPDIPRLPMLEALTKCGCSWVRSDQPNKGDSKIFKKGDKFIDLAVSVEASEEE